MTTGQRRGRRIAMSEDERDVFLTSERTCRVASSTAEGPHVAPLWFIWDGGALWLYSIVESQRWRDLERDRRVAVVVDRGENYDELRGVELRGRVTPVGEVPRVGAAVAELRAVEALWSEKYAAGTDTAHDGKHAWLRLDPSKIVSWDFRKMAQLAQAAETAGHQSPA